MNTANEPEDLTHLHFCTLCLAADPDEAGKQAIAENPGNVVAAAEGQPFEGAVLKAKKWKPGRLLRVRLLGGSAHVRARVEHYAKAWIDEGGANIRLEFVTAGDAEIRVSFEPGGSWSMLGTDALTVPATEPTMNFGWFDDGTADEEFSRTTIHEFGHALGAIHEQQHPDAGIPWDKEAVYAYYEKTQRWSRADVDHNLFRAYAKSTLNATDYDRLSIMHYAIPARLLTDPTKAVGWNRELSAGDRAFIRMVYPK